MANPVRANQQMTNEAEIGHLLSISGLTTDKVETRIYRRYNAFHL